VLPQQVSPPTRAEWVDSLLRRAILSGELRPGQKLLGEKLAEQWGVSATPLRESFQRLAGEGLVVIEPQRGARVAPIGANDVAEVYELRLLLDPVALRTSIEAARDGAAMQVDYVDQVSWAYEALVAQHRSSAAFHDAHHEFHLALVRWCPNQRLVRQVDQLLDQSQRYQALGGGAHRRGDASAEHRALRDAAVRGDGDAAVATLVAHLRATLEAVLAQA
jgi:DNA-binding GntR family transcriptional regulator